MKAFGTRIHTLCLLAMLAMPVGSNAYAETLSVRDWSWWNTVSAPLYPGSTWQRYATPEQAGWSSAKLSEAFETMKFAGSAAVTVVYNGAILAQWGDGTRRFKCHSMRKSLLSALYGIAVSEGHIDLTETIGSIGIDDDAGLTSEEKAATVADLLTSRSGVYLPAAYEIRSADYQRPKRGSLKPGTHWYYNNWDHNALGTIYNRKTGGDLFKAFASRIAAPLQMQDFALRHAYYHLEVKKSRHPAYPFRMSARDLARFGLLFLNEGKWRDTRIIPSQWVRESTRPHTVRFSGGYGYLWWTENGQLGELGTYMARGYGGHTVYVVPGAKLVLVHRADTWTGKFVDQTLIRKILLQVLAARVGPPRVNPSLLTEPASSGDKSGVAVTRAQLARLAGEYRRNRLAVSVRQIEEHLEIYSPRVGRFLLIPQSPTEFVAEDYEVPLKFTLDGDGRSATMRVWLKPDEPVDFTRSD